MNNEEIVLKSLLKHEPQHIRELARSTKLHPNTITTTISKLEKRKLVSIEKAEKTLIRYSDNKLAKNRKVMYAIEEIIGSDLLEFLDDRYTYPTVILFGSVQKGEAHKDSDIDICIISTEKKECDLKKFEKKLGRTIHCLLHTKTEFRKISEELRINILNGITLSGYCEF
ncbi:MAG: putative nucleotidyltransferase [Candidatus Woesearchaeota archaeon]|jgi:predicted nucleotidyltransferase